MGRQHLIHDESGQERANYLCDQIPIILKDNPKYQEICVNNICFDWVTEIYEDETPEEFANRWLDRAYRAMKQWIEIKQYLEGKEQNASKESTL